MKRLLLPLIAILALCGFRPGPAPTFTSGPVQLSIVDREQGQALPTWRDDEQQRWVAGEKGHRYSVRMRNTSGARVLVVLSVDGLNAITGEVAAPGQTGYVLDPWQSADISGWRKSQDEVAQFVFTSPGRSYASRTGRPDNIGVIGIAVFREATPYRRDLSPAIARRAEPASRGEAANESVADMARSSAKQAPAPTQRLGTGHGDRETSQVRDTAFERASSAPTQQLELRYDSERNLRARGILPSGPRQQPGRPQAFPSGYVPDPPQQGWR